MRHQHHTKLACLLALVNIKSMFILVAHLNGQLNGIPPKLFHKQSGHHIWTQQMAIVTCYKTSTIASEKNSLQWKIFLIHFVFTSGPTWNFFLNFNLTTQPTSIFIFIKKKKNFWVLLQACIKYFQIWTYWCKPI